MLARGHAMRWAEGGQGAGGDDQQEEEEEEDKEKRHSHHRHDDQHRGEEEAEAAAAAAPVSLATAPGPVRWPRDLTLGAALRRSLAEHGAQSVAVDDLATGRSATLGELLEAARAGAARLTTLLSSGGQCLPPEPAALVCVPDGADMVAAELACVEAGLVFVPVDPSTPPRRLRFLVEDSAPMVAIVRGADRQAVAAGLGGSAVPLQCVEGLLAGHLGFPSTAGAIHGRFRESSPSPRQFAMVLVSRKPRTIAGQGE